MYESRKRRGVRRRGDTLDALWRRSPATYNKCALALRRLATGRGAPWQLVEGSVADLALQGGVTFTDAEITSSSDSKLVGKTPKRQAKMVYQLTPTYTIGDAWVVGASIVGTSASKDDSPTGPLTVTLPAFTAVNAFVNVAITANASLTVGVNNLFDKKPPYTRQGDYFQVGYDPTVADPRGRTYTLALSYQFQ